MGNFRDNRSGGGHSFGRRSFDSDRGGDKQMFKTTCAKCGKECEVPFKPNGSKPVYCNDCFRTMGGSDSKRSSTHPQYKEQFEALNVKLDKILRLLCQETSRKQPKAPKVLVEEPIIKTTPNTTGGDNNENNDM